MWCAVGGKQWAKSSATFVTPKWKRFPFVASSSRRNWLIGLVLKYVQDLELRHLVCRGQNIWLIFARGMVIKPMIGVNIPTQRIPLVGSMTMYHSSHVPNMAHTHMLAQARHYMPMIFAPLPSQDDLIYFQCLDGREGARFLTCLYSSTSLYVVAFIKQLASNTFTQCGHIYEPSRPVTAVKTNRGLPWLPYMITIYPLCRKPVYDRSYR